MNFSNIKQAQPTAQIDRAVFITTPNRWPEAYESVRYQFSNDQIPLTAVIHGRHDELPSPDDRVPAEYDCLADPEYVFADLPPIYVNGMNSVDGADGVDNVNLAEFLDEPLEITDRMGRFAIRRTIERAKQEGVRTLMVLIDDVAKGSLRRAIIPIEPTGFIQPTDQSPSPNP